MKKLHLVISTDKIAATVADYSKRLNARPCLVIPDEYALWQTATLNLSIRYDTALPAGSLRHLGWEDPAAKEFTQDADVNGIVGDLFMPTTRQQKSISCGLKCIINRKLWASAASCGSQRTSPDSIIS